MLISLARPLKRALNGVPIVVTLQGEDLFLDGLPAPFRQQALDLIRAEVANVDMFVAVSQYCADLMQRYLDIPSQKLRVVPLGISPPDGPPAPLARAPFTIGYFARIAPEKGLHVLAEAYRILRHERGLPPSRLRAAGFCGPDQQGYLDGVRRGLRAAGLDDEFEYAGVAGSPGQVRVSARAGRVLGAQPLSRAEGALPARGDGRRVCRSSPPLTARCRTWSTPPAADWLRPRPSRLPSPTRCSNCGATRRRRADLGRRGRASVSSDFTVTRMAERVEAVYREAVS